MATDNIVMLKHIEIEESLQDIIADEYTSILFECKISDRSKECPTHKWYKDGKCVEPSYKLKASCSDKWYRLEITCVTRQDEGVYVVLLKNNATETFSTANLYVRQINRRNNNNIEVIYNNPTPKHFGVVRHLRCTKLLVGNTIELEAEFNMDALEDFLWYKSNHPLIPNERTIVLNDKRTTTLSILYAKETDTGIYHVVSKSKYGIASSFTSVVVFNTDSNTLNNSEIVPCIDEPLVDELEVNEGEEVRFLCKASYDANTSIQWSKNGKNIEENQNMALEYYNNKYICLRVKSTCLKDSGEYSICLRNEITEHLDSSSCFLTVTETSDEKRSSAKLIKPLEPTVTCFGTRVTFNCCFVLEDLRFYFVVWYIGHFRVERTNHRFHVMQSGGEFFLIIKQVDPGMAGEVTCELRKALPNRKSLLVSSTSSSLTIVPPDIFHREIKLYESSFKRNIFDSSNPLDITIKSGKDLNGVNKNIVSSNGDRNITETLHIMVITYCRLDDENFYLDVETKGNIDRMTVNEKTMEDKSKLVDFRWCDMQVSDLNVKKKWYIIELGNNTNDSFFQAGISTLPMFEVKNPPLEHLLRFRISTTECLNTTDESTVCIMPNENVLQKPHKTCELKPMEEFERIFVDTGEVIGRGAFGSVVLVRGKTEEFYAAKILKTRTQKKRETALREYETMRRLHHPKLVELYHTFSTRESFILVMDYLWGGELFDRIVEEEHIKEVDVVPYVRQICEALLYLHEQKIAHLDLKPENIICLSPNLRLVKIIDFGLARVLDEGQVIRAIYGTRDYVAPEVLNFERITLACDMWSLGVVTYVLLSGVMPFSGDSWPQRSANITMAKYNYNESAFKEISDLAKDFVNRLLVLQPEKRMTSSVALNHQWVVGGPPRGARAGHMKRARENLKSYLANHRARWQRAGNVLIAAHRLRTHASTQRNLNDKKSQQVT